MRRFAALLPLAVVIASVWSCTRGQGPAPDQADGGDDPAAGAVEEIRLDGTQGAFEDEGDVGEPALPYDTDFADEADWAGEDAKSDAQDEEEALEAIGDDLDNMDFTGVDLPYQSASSLEDVRVETKSLDARRPVSCRNRIYVDIQALGGLAEEPLGWRQSPPLSCWYPTRLTQESDWRGCFFNKDNKHDDGHRWYYDEASPAHAKTAEVSQIQGCADTKRPRSFGVQLLRNDGGWRFVEAPRTAAWLAQLFLNDDDVDSLWYKPSAYRRNEAIKAHSRSGPGINIGADVPLGKIAREVYKICRKVHGRKHMLLVSKAPLQGLDPALPFSKQTEAAKRLALVVKALDICTKRPTVDDGCFGKANACATGQLCAWNGTGYCCRMPGIGSPPCIMDSDCGGGNVCAEGPQGFACMKPECGHITPVGSEADMLEPCTSDTQQWWAGNKTRDITFIAFGDPHACDPSDGCSRNSSYGDNQSELMRDALNSTEAAEHPWPGGKGFAKEGSPYDHVRGVLIAGDLTQAGSETEPAGARVCREYTAYRNAFGRCGDEGRLLFPVYDSYGNHDFPRIKGTGDAAYHPVVDYLDRIAAAHRPGSAVDKFDDPAGNTGHYAWRWDDIWFVNVDLTPSRANEVIISGDSTRIAGPHDGRMFLAEFLGSRSTSSKRQIVIMAHYPMGSSRIDLDEKTAFCKLIHDAQKGTGLFSTQRLASAHPVLAYIHGHTHQPPSYHDWTCPNPYGSLSIPTFDAGTPLYAGSPNGPGQMHFSIFRIGPSELEVVGVGAPATDATGQWSYVYKERLGIVMPPD